MKIILATDFYYPNVSGVSIFVYRLAKQLQKNNHEVLIIAPSATMHSGSYIHDGLKVYGLYSMQLPLYRWLRVVPPAFIKNKIQKVISDFKPDVIHIQGHFVIGQTVLKIAEQKNIPTVGTNHFVPENLLHYVPSPFKAQASAWLARGVCSVFDRYTCVTTPTKTAADLLKHMNFQKPIHVISNGINREAFVARSSTYLQEKYNLANKKILLYVGRLDGEKNIDVVLKALTTISPNTSITFVITGQGTERKRLEQLVRDYKLTDRVVFTGFVANEDLAAVYQSADAFIMPSTAELQSIATMEAMSCGLPIIAANAMALPELVHHEKNGYLFSINNLPELTEYIKKIMNDETLLHTMGQHSLEIIEQHANAQVIQQYEALYKQSIEESSAVKNIPG